MLVKRDRADENPSAGDDGSDDAHEGAGDDELVGVAGARHQARADWQDATRHHEADRDPTLRVDEARPIGLAAVFMADGCARRRVRPTHHQRVVEDHHGQTCGRESTQQSQQLIGQRLRLDRAPLDQLEVCRPMALAADDADGPREPAVLRHQAAAKQLDERPPTTRRDGQQQERDPLGKQTTYLGGKEHGHGQKAPTLPWSSRPSRAAIARLRANVHAFANPSFRTSGRRVNV